MSSLNEFVNHPRPEDYVAALDELTTGPEYAPYAGHIEELERLFENGDYQAALDYATAKSATLVLSPTAHLMARMAAETLGDGEREDAERNQADLLLDCVLQSGDGSRDKPFLVSLVHDEYAVLTALDIKQTVQGFVVHGNRWLDVLKSDDDSETAFDVTRVLRRYKRQPER